MNKQCRTCQRTSEVVDMDNCPFCHTQEPQSGKAKVLLKGGGGGPGFCHKEVTLLGSDTNGNNTCNVYGYILDGVVNITRIEHIESRPQEPQSVPWEEEWTTEFLHWLEVSYHDDCDIMFHVRDNLVKNLLAQERQALVEKIEGMKLPVKERYFQPWKDYMIVGNECYNQALTDLLEHLKK